ncbi:SMI1/KNR4 family protein [Streptomyces sp. NBC_01537]|uniref:SMI1/KNR4 family protein n=1 Tax=Streptomyces sp. NBC_01537 TaxID=2903896 RepID=UPI003864F28C
MTKIPDWTSFLRTWSDERIAVRDLDDESVRHGWLGCEPATQDEIAAVETRLGLRLPPSYRRFLEASNGWRWAGEFVSELCSTGSVGLLRDMTDFLFEMLDEFEQEDLAEEGEDPEDEAVHRAGRWGRAVQVSLEGDLTWFLLDPGDVNAEGEWAAYSYASWRGEGPKRYESFADLMYANFQEFHRMRTPENATTRRIDAQVEQARADLLAGRLDDAVAALKEAQEFGRAQAGVYLFQVRVLQGNTYLLPEARKLLPESDAFRERGVLPVLAMLAEQGRHGYQETDRILDDHRRRIADGTLRPLEGEAAARARELAIRGDPEGAWRVLATEALPAWRPSSHSHVIPVELLADPFLGPLVTPERAGRILRTPRPGSPVELGTAGRSEDGIAWLLESTSWGRPPYLVTFAHGMDARELVLRIGADPGTVMPPSVAASRAVMRLADGQERGCLRAGTCGNGWSFAIENTTDRAGDAAVNPIPGVTLWRESSIAPLHFVYVDEQERTLCALTATAQGLEQGGAQPGLLDAALNESGAFASDASTRGIRMLKAVERHFGLTLPRDAVERHRLPVFRTPRRPRPEPSGPVLSLEFQRQEDPQGRRP